MRPTDRSLPEVHGSIRPQGTSTWRRLLAFSGPAFMVSVGYMDPGNWATDLAGGARFGYRLLWVILLSNLMAILLQTLSARLGIVAGRDLAQACRDHYPRPVVFVLWILCEIAIAACDLAEVLGSAIGLHLLTGLPILWGVVITGFDVLLFLLLQSFGIRRLEAVILSMVGTVGGCFAVEMLLAAPDWGAAAAGLVPGPISGDALYVSIGILGATVMPHNLYLHSALVQSRAVERTDAGLGEAARFNLVDSVVALNGAFFVNGAILVLAAAVFHSRGLTEVATLQEAHRLLAPLLGTTIAPIAFAVALLAAGQSSTITGTLAGQIVMEGFVEMRMRPWLRRLVTRLLAIGPAVGFILWKGDAGLDDLLILSQVVLSLQLPFAVVPLIHFTSSRKQMCNFVNPPVVRALAWASAAVIIGLNGNLVWETIRAGVSEDNPWVLYILLPATVLLVPLLAYLAAEPLHAVWRERRRAAEAPKALPVAGLPLGQKYRKIGIALEVSPGDAVVVAGIAPLAHAAGAEVVLIHVVESATARMIGEEVGDEEERGDSDYLEKTAARLREAGLECRVRIGAGEPEHEIARIAAEEELDLIVAGSHGHGIIGNLIHGSTVSELRHHTRVPVLSIRTDGR